VEAIAPKRNRNNNAAPQELPDELPNEIIDEPPRTANALVQKDRRRLRTKYTLANIANIDDEFLQLKRMNRNEEEAFQHAIDDIQADEKCWECFPARVPLLYDFLKAW
jgi:hypothetical protein